MDMIKEKMLGAKRIGLIVAALFLICLVFIATGCTGGVGDNAPAAPDTMLPTAKESGSGDDIIIEPGNDGSLDLGGEQTSKKKGSSKADGKDASTEDIISMDDEKMVMMTVSDTGRSDPFLPAYEAARNPNAQAEAAARERAARDKVLSDAKLKFDLVEPPARVANSEDAQKVMTTKVSGIIYDVDSPSAILNIEGADYLVRSGDVVNGYKILAIARDVVTVQYGVNVYKAGVGELLATDGINYNTISNLENKFGGGGRK